MSVYLVQMPKPNRAGWQPDLTPATEFGEIKSVFSPDDSVYSLPAPMISKAMEVLKDFDPEKDFILWPNSGDPAAVWTCSFALVMLGFKKAKFLYYNRKKIDGQRSYQKGFYVPLEYNLDPNFYLNRLK